MLISKLVYNMIWSIFNIMKLLNNYNINLK